MMIRKSIMMLTICAGMSGTALSYRVEVGGDRHTVGAESFRGDTLLTEVVVLPGTTSIEDFAFADCSNLKSVTFLDNSLQSIGQYAFLGCGNLSAINLPEDIKEIGEGCFRESGLEEIVVPVGIKEVPKFFCAMSPNLQRVQLPDRVEKISMHAFSYCPQLTTINDDNHLPPAIKDIGLNAFARCTSLNEIYLPDSVDELESYAFAGCTALTTCRLPDNASLLGELIFSGCESLTILIEPSPVPPPFDCDSLPSESPDWHYKVPKDCAGPFYSRCILLVPPSSIDSYRATYPWSLFTTILPTPQP